MLSTVLPCVLFADDICKCFVCKLLLGKCPVLNVYLEIFNEVWCEVEFDAVLVFRFCFA